MGSNPFQKKVSKKILKRRRYNNFPVEKKHKSFHFPLISINKTLNQ